MNGLPYYKRYPRDFIEGTIGMPFELKAAYSIILDLIYLQGGKLPDDAGYISGLLGVSKRKWSSIRKGLVEAGKLQVGGGYLSNYRAIIELENLRYFQDKQRENRTGCKKNKELQKPRSNHTEPEPDTEKENKFSFLPEEPKNDAERAALRYEARRLDRDEGQGNVVALSRGLETG